MGPRYLIVIGLVSVSLVAVSPSGCGNRGTYDTAISAVCLPGAATCLSKDVGQICNAQRQWVTFQCSGSRQCEAGACTQIESPSCSGGERECVSDSVGQLCTNEGGWISFICEMGQTCRDGDCQQTCTSNTHECDPNGLQRVCREDGAGWYVSQCPSGSLCEDGACTGSCAADSATCVTEQLVRTCRADASGYSEHECPPSMTCVNGNCESRTSIGCSGESSVCLDETTALACARNGAAYTVKDCPQGTRCFGGRCMGKVCAAELSSCSEATVANFNGIQTCNEDGSAYAITLCNSGGKCVTDAETGKPECYVPPCAAGERVCGDPTTGTDSTGVLSRCDTLPNGKLGWVAYRCDAPTSCKSKTSTTTVCSVECSPGDQRCSKSGTATETCDSDGTWTTKKCSRANGTEEVCVLVPETKKAVCGDRDCRTLHGSASAYESRGRCAGDKIRRCGTDGRIGTAVDCTEGRCFVGTDGLGTCDDATRCDHEDGWRECVVDTMDAYRVCTAGHWKFEVCPAGEPCTKISDGLAACGNDCVANQRRCVDAGYKECAGDGTWGAVQKCKTGECNPKTNSCETACVPGEIRCTGDVVGASDGSSYGSVAYQTCSADGAWGAATSCASSSGGNTLCRRSGFGTHLGCLQCVGSDVEGGNEEGAMDSRCSADLTGRQDCQDNNTWPTSASACAVPDAGSATCVKQRDGSVTGTCSNYGCSLATTKPRRCIGYETVTTPVTISDCCADDCDSENGTCLHRKSHYDPGCPETTQCNTGRYDADGMAIKETCCSGFCISSVGCLKIKANPCANVESCSVTRVDHHSICCGSCQTGGLCDKDAEAPHPAGEYFYCGTTSNLCWGMGSCTYKKSGTSSGAQFANCVEE